jgi:hypothetical protein
MRMCAARAISVDTMAHFDRCSNTPTTTSLAFSQASVRRSVTLTSSAAGSVSRARCSRRYLPHPLLPPRLARM